MAGIRLGIILFQPGRDRTEIRLRERQRNILFETPKDIVSMIVAVARQFGGQRERGHHIHAAGVIKFFRQDANNCALDTVKTDCLVDNVRIAAKAPLPQTIAQDHHCVFAGLVFFGGKRAT